MTAPHADQLIDGYLARLRVAAADLPSSVRDELIEDMRAHIAEARAREPQETDATVLNMLDRLGEPDVVVAEAWQRPSAFSSQPATAAASYSPGFLEIAAVVLLPFIWPIAVILLWLSPAWRVRDKIVGTIFSVGGYPGIAMVGLYATQASPSASVAIEVVQPGATAAGSIVQAGSTGPTPLDVLGHVAGVIVLIIFFLLPVLTAGYLAFRLQWGRRMAAAA